jgi:TPR repeat protein
MAEQGWGEPQSYAEAFSWYYKAAEHGNDTAQENIGYNFQNGVGVNKDYAKAMFWLYKAAGQGNSDAENQLGWMYQFGQGVQPDDGKALAWYRLSADQGNIHGLNNLQAFKEILEDRGEAVWQSASDAAIAQAQQRVRIQDLHSRINTLEAEANQQDSLADQLEHTGKGKTDKITKVFNAMGTVGAVKFRVEAAKYRAEASRLREELAGIENQNQFSANVPVP